MSAWSNDLVNNPPHYVGNGIECIDAIEASMSKLEFCGYLKGNAMKYLWRYSQKGNQEQDLQKSIWYTNKLLQTLTKDTTKVC